MPPFNLKQNLTQPANAMRQRYRRRSFSMAEAALAVFVAGAMMVTALNMVGMSARARKVNAELGKGHALAHGLMSEVLQGYYENPETEPILVEGPETELTSYDPSSPDDKDYDVKNDNYIGQLFRPTLPDDAVSWSITQVKFKARYKNDQDGTASVQLRTLDDSNMPTDAILGQYSLPETKMPADFDWITMLTGGVSDLTPGAGLALIIAIQIDDGDVCEVEYDRNGGTGMVTTANGGGHWTSASNRLPLYVYGKVTVDSAASGAIGPEADEGTSNRADFDDVDDYDGWTATPPQEKNGTELAEYDGWTRSVTVEYVDPLSPGNTAISTDSGAKRITVTVTDPRGAKTSIVSVRTDAGTYEQEVTSTRTYCSWIGLDLQIGESNPPLQLGASLSNEPEVAN